MKNIVVVGFGGMGSWHVEYILKSDVVKLLGIYDIKESRSEAARTRGIYAFSSLDEVLADARVDIVLIATPNDVHKEIAVKALNAGKNVISEKPVTLSSSNLQEMIDASVKSGKLFTVHQNRRWDCDYLAVKQIYESGILGYVFNIESRVHGSRGIPGDWRGKKEQGGGMMLDWGVHIIDQILMMVKGKITRLYAHFDHITNYEVDDGFKLELIFDNSLRVFLEVGTSNFVSLPRWYMQGENGTTVLNDFACEGRTVCVENWDEKDVIPVKTAAGLTKTMAPRKDDAIVTHSIPQIESDVHDFYRNVVKAVDGIQPQLITHQQLMRVMKVMEAAFKSDELGQTLTVEL
ncbi:MAG: dehydrogenase [Clostridiales bacterium GWF2_38_85]|nr:MAG: dehydrogenase [Clostridiales bacterium GWF2_38_85]HBL83799.1 gfo/Idh/MocA family oxidoreductase [Clostridiales bacterium]